MTKDPSTQLPVGEPSVLDYVLAVLAYWRARFIKLFNWRAETPDFPKLLASGETAAVVAVKREAIAFELPKIPWRILLMLVFMLAAQLSLEFSPTNPAETKSFGAIILYGLMLTLAIALQWGGELRLAEPAAQVDSADDWKAYWPPLVLGVILSVLAYFSFGSLHFNPLNVVLWLTGLGLIVVALWRSEFQFSALQERITAFREQPFWTVKITRWGLAVVFTFIIGVFYRYYMFGEVMPDMISDHAEKLLDVFDVTNGQNHVFFSRNNGREPFQFYLIAWTIKVFKTGITFTSMKIGTIAFGVLTLPYIYLLGKEVGNRRVGLFAMLLAGMAFWPNILARVALRFILYSTFVAPVLYHLIRGLRTGRRNDFILVGLFLGVGLQGFTSFRVVPVLVVLAIILFALHIRNWKSIRSAILWLGIVLVVSFLVFLPLARFWVAQPDIFNSLWASRATSVDIELSAPAWQIFIQNTLDALLMFNVDNRENWVLSIPNRPALDFVSGGLLVLGAVLLIVRYFRKRHWQDLLLLVSVPVLMSPYIIALAFPAENPAPSGSSGVIVVLFVIIGFALDAVLQAIQNKMEGQAGHRAAVIVGVFLLGMSAMANYTLTFNAYRTQFMEHAWNTSEMGAVVQNFAETVGSRDQVWVVAFPHWVDTRLVGMEAGFAQKDYAIWPEAVEETLSIPGPKMFLVKYDDFEGLQTLEEVYPDGAYSLFESERGSHRDFYIFFVPAND